MSRLEYRQVAIQNQCLGGSKKERKLWVFVKLAAQGKNKTYYKTDVIEFPNRHHLKKFLDETQLPIIDEKDFKADAVAQTIALFKASQS